MGNALGGSVFVVAGIVVLYMIATGRMQEILTGTSTTTPTHLPATPSSPGVPGPGSAGSWGAPDVQAPGTTVTFPYQNLVNMNTIPMRVA